MPDKYKVAFICVHNSCRSQMAEAIGKHLAGEIFECFSAGTQVVPQINPQAVQTIQQLYGVDMRQSQYSKTLDALPSIDIVVTMGCNVACPGIACSYREDWGLDDPTGKDDEVFKETARHIEKKLLALKNRFA